MDSNIGTAETLRKWSYRHSGGGLKCRAEIARNSSCFLHRRVRMSNGSQEWRVTGFIVEMDVQKQVQVVSDELQMTPKSALLSAFGADKQAAIEEGLKCGAEPCPWKVQRSSSCLPFTLKVDF